MSQPGRGPYKKTQPAAARFWAKVDPFGPVSEYVPRLGRCWNWVPAKGGYGMFGAAYKSVVPAYRYAYELFIGPIPDGLTVDHLCFNPSCVNPRHLEAVPLAENLRRAWAAGRFDQRVADQQTTHCTHGHEFTDANTRLDPGGSRHCRTCDDRHRADRAERRRLARIEKYGYDPGPFARFNPAKAVRA